MMRFLLISIFAAALGVSAPSTAQTQTPPAAAPSALTADQARAALDVLNDPAKRAAFSATLNAIIKGQPATPVPASSEPASPAAASSPATATPGTAPPADTKPPAPHTVVEGLSIPLAPDSLGAQVLLSASAFVNHLGEQAMEALDTVQSLPLLYGWAVVMTTNPVARNILMDVSWRVILAVACAAAVEIGLRRAMQRPIRSLESLAPAGRVDGSGGSAAEHGRYDPESDDGEISDGEISDGEISDGETQTAGVQTPGGQAADRDGLVRTEAGGTDAPHHRRPRPSAWTLLKRLPLVLARLLLELVPVLGIVVIGHLIAGSALGGQTVSRLIILAVIDAYAVCAALLSVAHMLLSPRDYQLRLFHLHDQTATYLMYWVRRLIVIAVVGYAIGEVGLLLGLSEIAHDAFEKAVGLLLHLCVATIVIQKRRAVRRRLSAPPGATGPLATVRNRFARVWHLIALFFLIAGWLIWAVEVPHGYAAVMHYFVVTGLVLIGARLTLMLLLGVVDRVMQPGPETPDFYPGMHARLRIYHPVVSVALRLTIYLMTVLGLLQLYGLNTFLWLVESALGLRLLSASGTLLLTIVLAFGAWEAMNGGVQRHLDRLQREAQLAKSARLRTLLPLLRTTVLVTIAIVAGLMILSEIGINIAPLLAGAGIIGVAIGFGSQKLVQDLITGIFLLLENAMQVGDTVTVSGLSGVVENLSIRTIRLRAGDGSVHIIPFSSVTSVTNVNRGLGNASVIVSVDYAEDTDRVCAELTAIVDRMRNDPALSAMMLSDFQLWGVDKVDGGEVTIAGQVVCTDSGRWPVQREFNRRMKRRFQELGIRIFNPVQTIAVPITVQAPAEKGDERAHAQAAD